MNILYYSADNGKKALQMALSKINIRPVQNIQEQFMEASITPGEIIYVGRDTKENMVYCCGVSASESVCRLIWIHALAEMGQTISDWIFYKVE